MAGHRGNGDQVHRMSDQSRITGGHRKKGGGERMADQAQRPEIVVIRARPASERYGVSLRVAVFGSHDDPNQVAPFGQSHLMAGGVGVGIGRQYGN